jgi:hypothetical protein
VKRFIAVLAASLLLVAVPVFAQVQINKDTANQSVIQGNTNTSSSTSGATGGTAVQQQGQSQSSTNVNKNANTNANSLANANQNNPTTEQNITSISSPNLIQLPGVPGAYPQFTQPYKPDVFLNGAGPVMPANLTYEQAKGCSGGYFGYDSDYEGKKGDRVQTIKLVYPAREKQQGREIAVLEDVTKYQGVATASADDKPFLPTLCKAAIEAMDHGVDYGVVEFIVKPKNKNKGVMLGASFGSSGIAGATMSPYALAGVAGGGLGWSSAEVEGKVMIQITGLSTGQKTALVEPTPAAVSPAPASAAPTPAAPPTAAPPALKPAVSQPAPAVVGEPIGARGCPQSQYGPLGGCIKK